eukprot:gnl/MRDRNA2_/MRDRNA2_70225_c0_seq1.p1 gnl/MRDRNA2_/MRDRNA2_70225_c0~~gnl/MRDRNA2_/MRDRNA2_70225_c0_seq1.p1  ORF type:complete len:444 (+),score=69.09 gnl/MRDRNA2_/MRDRNA2_70225_c0_seq1:160-1491(+)
MSVSTLQASCCERRTGSEVCFQFNFNQNVIDAIKEHLPGRRWDAADRRWKCSLESLPEAIALYEHMGRTADPELKSRAAQVREKCGGGVSSATIRLVVMFQISQASADSHDLPRLGSCTLTCNYDPNIVAAIKQIPPAHRMYEPPTKSWKVDLLAMPELIEVLRPLGYTPNHKLGEVSRLLVQLSRLLFLSPPPEQNNECPDVQPDNIDPSPSPQNKSNGECLNAELNKSHPASDKARELQGYDQKPGTSDSSSDRALEVQRVMKQLTQLVQTETCSAEGIDRSDVGSAKRRKLTRQQKAWRSGGLETFSGSEDSDFEDFDFLPLLRHASNFDCFRNPRLIAPPRDCDCGNPHIIIAGRHHCRYYGTFRCSSCNNEWTSAYTWRGEKQACRRCETESFPVKTEPLEKRLGMSRINGAHDCERCSKCQTLGYDCSGRGTWTQIM